MLELKGTLRRLTKRRVAPPNDGVHRPDGKGGIRSPFIYRIGERIVYGGNEGIFVPDGDQTGIKIMYTFKGGKAFSLSRVSDIYGKMGEFERLCVPVFGIEKVVLAIRYRNAKINQECYGIRVKRVVYPEKAWERFLLGYPYDWNASNLPSHTISGYRRFVKGAKRVMGNRYKFHLKSLVLGNVAYCTEDKRWYVMDIDWHAIADERKHAK